MDPGFRLGSTSLDVGGSARLGSGPFVFEGDEYTTAPWDRRPKFLHMRPLAACVTRLEWDHPDVYPSPEAYRLPFVQLAETMPEDGLLVLCGDDPDALELRDHAACPVTVYGEGDGAGWRVVRLADDGHVQRFRVEHPGQPVPEVALTFPGRHNALNATAALALAGFAGAPIPECVAACADFRGPARRFEILGSAGGVTVVDDYAHHPTEVWAASTRRGPATAGRASSRSTPPTPTPGRSPCSRTTGAASTRPTSWSSAPSRPPASAARRRPSARPTWRPGWPGGRSTWSTAATRASS